MANNIAITTTIEEQLFEDIKKTHDENNVSFVEYQQRHNKLLEVYNNNIKFIDLQKSTGRITNIEWCCYIQKIQEDFMVKLSKIHDIINPVINQIKSYQKMNRHYEDEDEDEDEDDPFSEKEDSLFNDKIRLRANFMGITGGCLYNS